MSNSTRLASNTARRQREIGARIYEIKEKLRFDERVSKAGNPGQITAEDRHALIDELDALYAEARALAEQASTPTKEYT